MQMFTHIDPSTIKMRQRDMKYRIFHPEIYAPLRFFPRSSSVSFFINTHTHIIYGVEPLIGVLTSISMCIVYNTYMYVFAKGWALICTQHSSILYYTVRVYDWLE